MPTAETNTTDASGIGGTPDDLEFDQDVAEVDLEIAGRYEFTFKTGGTSIGFKIRKIGKRNKFMFLPENGSTRLEGEVAYYRLSRILGVSDFFNPVEYYDLGPSAITKFKAMLRRERNRLRRKNTEDIRARIRRNPNSLPGIIKFRSKRDSQGVDAFVSNNRFRTNTTFAKFIKGNGAQPGPGRISIPGVRREKPEYPAPTASEISLARQLSTIFVFDMLFGQWDRFSGGNIEAYAFKDGGLQFIGRDNGGSHLLWGDNWYNKYTRWVTRFDRDVVVQLSALHRFLSGDAESFKGFEDPEDFEDALGLRSPGSFGEFKRKLERFVTEHVAKAERRHGDGAYFDGT